MQGVVLFEIIEGTANYLVINKTSEQVRTAQRWLACATRKQAKLSGEVALRLWNGNLHTGRGLRLGASLTEDRRCEREINVLAFCAHCSFLRHRTAPTRRVVANEKCGLAIRMP
ncbi:MAG: hypothetical protein HY360_02065 [Verrucomicrobia bacterium]|nr:hypothetical protein [Verrucomicrobiota bacterium]